MLAIPVELIEIGCSIYALHADQTDADMRLVKGGVVVAVETAADRDTGEIERRFVTATPWRGQVRFDALVAGEVAQAEPPNVASLRALIRTAARVVADSKRTFTTDESRCIALQHNLMEVM